MRTLTDQEVKDFYDRFGARQDSQVFYEASALDALVSHAQLGSATALLELGCGTGRFAHELLSHHVAPTALLYAFDVSETMVQLATDRLARFAPRAQVRLANANEPLPVPDAAVDRFVSTYVLDLLPEAGIAEKLAEAHRVLTPGGLLCLAGITPGTSAPSRVVMGIWDALFRLKPSLVGGCRPIRLVQHIAPSAWRIQHHAVVVAWGVASEVVVATRLAAPNAAA